MRRLLLHPDTELPEAWLLASRMDAGETREQAAAEVEATLK